MFTDAISDGYGGFLLTRVGKDVVVGKFDDLESELSSTAHEQLNMFCNRLIHQSYIHLFVFTLSLVLLQNVYQHFVMGILSE